MWARSKSISSKQVCDTISRIAFRTVLAGEIRTLRASSFRLRHPTPYTLNAESFTLHLTPYTFNSTLCTLHA